MNFNERINLYIKLTRLNRPIGILLLLWPTLWGMWIAGNGQPAWSIVAIFVLGTVLMRSAGCAINDYADRDFDKQVKRTQDRPLTCGKLAPKEALWLPEPRERGGSDRFDRRPSAFPGFSCVTREKRGAKQHHTRTKEA